MEKSKPKTNLTNILLLFFSAGLILIGINETINAGFENSYWIFMISIALFLYYQIRKNKKKQEDNTPPMNRRAKRYMDRNH
jgi:amino acid permease